MGELTSACAPYDDVLKLNRILDCREQMVRRRELFLNKWERHLVQKREQLARKELLIAAREQSKDTKKVTHHRLSAKRVISWLCRALQL